MFIFVQILFFFLKREKKKRKKKKALLVVDLGGPPKCLCSGPGSDSGVNEGLVSLFVSAYLYGFPFTSFFRRVILVSPRGSWRVGTRIYSLGYLSLFALWHKEPSTLAPWRCPFGERLESFLRLIWSFLLPLSRPSLVSATTKGF